MVPVGDRTVRQVKKLRLRRFAQAWLAVCYYLMKRSILITTWGIFFVLFVCSMGELNDFSSES